MPSLALTADQIVKIKEAFQDCGSIEVHNLDKLTPSDLRDAIISRMQEIDYDSSSTMFLFSSP